MLHFPRSLEVYYVDVNHVLVDLESRGVMLHMENYFYVYFWLSAYEGVKLS